MGFWKTEKLVCIHQLLHESKDILAASRKLFPCRNTADKLPYMPVWISHEFVLQLLSTATGTLLVLKEML